MRSYRSMRGWGACLVLAVAVSSGAGDTIHESASLGPTGINIGARVSEIQFLGSRFQVTRTVEVSAVGGHLTMHEGFEGLTLFAAIVVLSDPAALPVGAPLDEGEVVASTVFDAGRPSSDVRVPLAATLAPGAYALIFGSGLFGATGVGGMPLNNADLPGASYFFWNGNAWIDDPFGGARFVVEGSICVIDSDGDGVDDDVDVCCNTPGFTTVDAQGRPVGDLDNDCDVDLADFVMFEIDLSAGYVQLNGFAGLQNNFTGELPADGPCR